jgi:hypothetical protein
LEKGRNLVRPSARADWRQIRSIGEENATGLSEKTLENGKVFGGDRGKDADFAGQ